MEPNVARWPDQAGQLTEPEEAPQAAGIDQALLGVVLQKRMRAWGEAGMLYLCGQPEHLVDHTVLGEDIPLRHALDLAFTQHMGGFIALNGSLRRLEGSKP